MIPKISFFQSFIFFVADLCFVALFGCCYFFSLAILQISDGDKIRVIWFRSFELNHDIAELIDCLLLLYFKKNPV